MNCRPVVEAVVRVALAAIPFVVPLSVSVSAFDLGLPAECTPGEDCFVQQYPDMDSGPGAVDPFCGSATYNGHDGTDLRILSMKDVALGVPVVAMADGKVLRIRDGVPDRLVLTAEDRKAVASRECGNGVVIQHGDGIETQYCHMKQGSIAVHSGDRIHKGAVIGEIGASGMAQFPHVHVTVRKEGRAVDPSTGRTVANGCDESAGTKSLFSQETLGRLGRGETQILSFGLAGAPVEHSQLGVSGPPAPADIKSSALVGWAWLQNLRKGDRISVAVTGSDGRLLLTRTTEPMHRTKASYSFYAGKRGVPVPGAYLVTVRLLRDGRGVFEKTGRYWIK